MEDAFPIDMPRQEWGFRRQTQLQQMGLDGRSIALQLYKEEMARIDARRRRDQERAALAKRRPSRTDAQTMPLARYIARRIAAERVAARQRQEDLARAIGISHDALGRIERGKRPATAAELVLIADELGRPLEAFVPEPDVREPSETGGA